MSRTIWAAASCVVAGCSSPPAPVLSGSGTAKAGALELPTELPIEPTCLGFLSDGNGALVVTTSRDRFDDSQGTLEVILGFAMRDGAPPPFAFTHSFSESDATAWRTQRTDLTAKLSGTTLLPCTLVERSEGRWPLSGERSLTEEWDATPAVNQDADPDNDVALSGRVRLSDRSADRILATMVSGPHDGTDHEHLESVYRSPTATTLALVIDNQDTGMRSQRFVIAKLAAGPRP